MLVRISLATCEWLHHLLLLEVTVTRILVLICNRLFWGEYRAKIESLRIVGRVINRTVDV